MLAWFKEYETLFWWMTAVSAVLFILTLIATPMLIARIPEDYFSKEDRPASQFAKLHPVWRFFLLLIKNILGVILVIAGLAMLLLPGQGLLTLLLAMILLDIPGKYRFQRWLILRPRVSKSVNWIRQRAGRPPLQLATQSPA